MITMSLNQIRQWSPCVVGYTKLLKAQGKIMPDDVQIPLLDILESNGIRDAIWCMRVNWFDNKKLYMQFTSGCVIRTAGVADAAAYAAAYAADAYDAADAAAYAAYAYDAADAAADAAAYAAGAAYTAADAAAAAAAEREIQTKHLAYLLRGSK